MAAPFQADYRTVAINPAGYGETALLSASVPMTVRDEAQALAAVIHTERPDNRGVHVVGHSYGGTIALALACYWPDLVARLILLEPAPYPLLRAAGEAAFANEISRHNQRFIATVRDGGRDAVAMEQYLDYFNNHPGF
ncbi:MAG: alpha/beta hydrolase, partial [Rhodospirillaceae bacterium]|nr:alpha/beta hydrolase [Rhodospirillaceae bacterium]